MIPAAILQFYKCGEILEYFYDEIKFPIDFDLKGSIYRLNRNANNMSRSTVLYHPSILSDKRDVIRKANNLINESLEMILQDAARLLVLNKECATKLVELVQGNAENTCYTPMIQEQLNCDFL